MIWLGEIIFDHDYSFSLCEFIVTKVLASQRFQEIHMIRIKHHFIRAGSELFPNLSLFIEIAQEGESGGHVFKSADPEEPIVFAFDPELPQHKTAQDTLRVEKVFLKIITKSLANRRLQKIISQFDDFKACI